MDVFLSCCDRSTGHGSLFHQSCYRMEDSEPLLPPYLSGDANTQDGRVHPGLRRVLPSDLLQQRDPLRCRPGLPLPGPSIVSPPVLSSTKGCRHPILSLHSCHPVHVVPDADGTGFFDPNVTKYAMVYQNGGRIHRSTFGCDVCHSSLFAYLGIRGGGSPVCEEDVTQDEASE